MPINKVIYGSITLIDLSSDTITSDKLLSGVTAHDKSGTPIIGTRVSASVETENLVLEGTVDGENLTL